MKQSSVEWLQWALEHTILTHEQTMQTIGLFEQAKAMHKEEHEKTYSEGLNYNQYQRDLEYGGAEYWIKEPKQFEQYYNETFGGEDEQQ